MISNLKCIDLNEQYFDEIDESEKNSAFTRNEECNHFEVSMRRITENSMFKKYFLNIECKNCNTLLKKVLTKNKDSISYYCKKCNMPQICINFSYENTIGFDEESNIRKDENQININENPSNGINIDVNPGPIIIRTPDPDGSKFIRTPDPNVFTIPGPKIFYTPSTLKENEKKIKTYKTPDSNTNIKKKIYSTPEKKEIEFNFSFNDIKKKIVLNEVECLERQCKTIKEAFKIKNEKNIYIVDNSEPIDKKQSPKELGWNPDMIFEIEIDNN